MRQLLIGSSVAVLTALTLASCFDDTFSSSCSNSLTCADATGGSAGETGTGGTTAGTGGAGAGSNGGAPATCDVECKGSKPVCFEGDCVECTEDDDSACVDTETPLCNTETHKCVACLDNETCKDASASHCSDDGECTKCSEPDHCLHIDGATACDTETGSCVECTVEDERACGDNSCNPETHECTGTVRGSVKACGACVADSECPVDHRCVGMNFNGEAREGGYCLKIFSTGCSRPYGVPTPERESLSGAPPTKYCGVNETVTTCEAVRAIGNTCAKDADCGAAGIGGLCKLVNGIANTCTYSCGGVVQCTSAYPCPGDATPEAPEYCGAP